MVGATATATMKHNASVQIDFLFCIRLLLHVYFASDVDGPRDSNKKSADRPNRDVGKSANAGVGNTGTEQISAHEVHKPIIFWCGSILRDHPMETTLFLNSASLSCASRASCGSFPIMHIGKNSPKLVELRRAIRDGTLTSAGLLPIE